MSNGKYIDVFLSSGSTFTKLEFTDCELNGGTSLEWWNPQADGGNGEWEAVSNQTYAAGPPPCITVTVEGTTKPDLAQMTGTVFSAALPAGSPLAWGDNYWGQLGDGTTLSNDVPELVSPSVPPGVSVTAVSAGYSHSLALLSNGTVMAWGANNVGELGDGNNSDSSVPVTVSGLSEVAAVAAGGAYSLALLKNGTVMAWGWNYYGELGDGSTTNSDLPVPVSLSLPAGVKVTAISAGYDHSLALLSNGTVMAWGQNQYGELGDGSSSGPQTCNLSACSKVPVAVSLPSEATAVAAGGEGAAGGEHSLAVLGDGNVMAWGSNQYGQLGDGNNTGPENCGVFGVCSTTPVAVSGISDVAGIAAGEELSLALLKDGTVAAWGTNGGGALGDGNLTNSYVPVAVKNLSGVTAVSAGNQGGLALLEGGGVMAWGQNVDGQLGIGTLGGGYDEPVEVDYLYDVGSISAGNGFALAAGQAAVPPTVETGSVSEVTQTSATFNAMVNPNDATVSKCEFEYGTTSGYGKSEPCSPLPGAGTSPVAAAASVSGLIANTTYHYRVVATNEGGTSNSDDQTFLTPSSSESASTLEPTVPAKATAGALSATASEGVGTVRVGEYASDPAEPPPFVSSGKYVDVGLAAGRTFKKVEFKDCELNGAKMAWWANAASDWQPVPASAVAYTSSPGPCLTVTITDKTTPDLAQLTGTRFGYGELGPPEYGKCEATKHGSFTEAACATIAEKKGVPDHKGKYEWFAGPEGCYAHKKGHYEDSACTKEAVSENKRTHEKKYKGKYEKGNGKFTGTSGATKFAISDVATLECAAGSSEGEITGTKTATETVTYTGCHQASATCSSADEPAETIRTYPLESFIYDVDNKVYTEITGSPIMKFTCGSSELTLTGSASGEAVGDINTMSATNELVFKQGVGRQVLDTGVSGRSLRTILTVSETATGEQSVEVKR